MARFWRFIGDESTGLGKGVKRTMVSSRHPSCIEK